MSHKNQEPDTVILANDGSSGLFSGCGYNSHIEAFPIKSIYQTVLRGLSFSQTFWPFHHHSLYRQYQSVGLSQVK